MREKLVLIDGHSLLFRAFYGMPPMTAADKTPTNAIFGFLRILFRILDTEKPSYLAVAFDSAAPTFRHKLYGDYKGTRKAAPPEFHVQEPLLRQILTAMAVPIISREGYEADDILGTLAVKGEALGLEVVIVSGDHDLLQTATEHIRISIPAAKSGKTEGEDYYAADVIEKYGVTPKAFIDVKALMGDSSDNIPGLPGVGKVTATKLIQTYGSIEAAHAHVDEIKPAKARNAMRDHYDLAVLSKQLATICLDAPFDIDEEAFRLGNLYTPEAYEIFKTLGFKTFFERFETAPAAAAAEDYEVIDTADGLVRVREAFGEGSCLGLAFVCDKTLLAACLADSSRRLVMRPSEDLTEAGILETVSAICGKAAEIASCHMKLTAGLIGLPGQADLFDAVVAAYLLNPLKSDYDYADIAAEYLAQTLPSPEELLGRKKPSAAEDKDKIALLSALSAGTALASRPVLLKKLEEEGMLSLFRDIEVPLTGVLASMETAGIRCDTDELKAYSDKLGERITTLTARIYEAAGETFNLNSPRQLGDILFGKMKLPGGKKTKTGYSTAAGVLEKLAPDVPMVADILEYRQLSKLKSTYADGLSAYIGEDGRIHTTFNQTITATGRLSSTEPNLQNIPMRDDLGRAIRRCFKPAPGCVFVDADYSQIELRILAHMSGDSELIAAYREARDIHRITASQVFHVPFEEVTDQQRRNAKAVNFGIIYGISSFGLSQGLSITPKEAEAYIKAYFAAYPTIHSFIRGLVEKAGKTGYAVSLFGRRRPIPELSAANFMQRSFGERVAMNSPIQGTAADIMKIAMIRVDRRLKAEKLSSRLILQIHDELLVEAPEAEAEAVERILREEMAGAASLSVPLETDCHSGRDWYEAK
ncbi:MAG: DNA polymerase I [Lachnospiraceae bacterium]|nr:DNA polymerase I [Lachnospiraceae bacterium]